MKKQKPKIEEIYSIRLKGDLVGCLDKLIARDGFQIKTEAIRFIMRKGFEAEGIK